MVFLNREQFEGIALPLAAQAAPAFSAVVVDFNSDGREDVFLSQNFFGLPMDVPRQDAGRGLVLIGNGEGGFTPLDHSGIAAYGEQRGAAAIDIEGDGRPDLILTQHGAETKLYRNLGLAL
jgi:hypothetical protein